MKLIRMEKNDKYTEIELEDSFFGLFKTRTVYRRYNGIVFEFEHPDIYKPIGIFSHREIYPYFNIEL